MSLLSSGGVAGNMTALQAYETSTLGLSFGGAGVMSEIKLKFIQASAGSLTLARDGSDTRKCAL